MFFRKKNIGVEQYQIFSKISTKKYTKENNCNKTKIPYNIFVPSVCCKRKLINVYTKLIDLKSETLQLEQLFQ